MIKNLRTAAMGKERKNHLKKITFIFLAWICIISECKHENQKSSIESEGSSGHSNEHSNVETKESQTFQQQEHASTPFHSQTSDNVPIQQPSAQHDDTISPPSKINDKHLNKKQDAIKKPYHQATEKYSQEASVSESRTETQNTQNTNAGEQQIKNQGNLKSESDKTETKTSIDSSNPQVIQRDPNELSSVEPSATQQELTSQENPLGNALSNDPVHEEQPSANHPPPQATTSEVTPPILPEVEDEDDENVEEQEEGEHGQEEIEAEIVFQAGEKLINATYYKEYKEAYLHFLKSADMNHKKAKEYVAFGYLFGDYLPQNVTKAAEMFVELADKGSPKAQMGLSFMYSAGFHYNSSQAKALIFSTFGALGGDPLAQMALGYRYYAGIGVESKCESALTYYRKVASKVADSVTLAGGPVVQRIRLQEEAESQGTNNSPLLDDDLLQYYHFLADKGDQQAQVVLGTLYYQGGKGVQINHEQAYHYFSTAAESGSGHALGYLGKMHSEGSPVVKQSNMTAFEYFKKSADKNNHVGQAGLGMMYLNGLGVEKDAQKAFRYFSLASDQGSVDGQLQLGIMYFNGNGIRKDYKMAVKYFTMASQNGHVLAFYNLAQMHATGTGVLRNCHTAVELFKNVAERGRWSEMMMDAHRMYHEGNVDTALIKYMFLAELGYEVAQSNVAYILDNGATGRFSKHETYQRALLQYSRAASQGSTYARLKMGDYHYYGLGTEIDYESAASHYRMASEQQHNAQAMFNLGYMHEKGLGLKQDVHLAKRFYDMASETSLDAHVPVTLALLKLGLLYGMDVFNKEFEGVSGILGMMDPVTYFGPEWDLYLASLLAVLFAILYFVRRAR